MIFQLGDYGTAVSPFVAKVIENLVKLFLGEEYRLASDMIATLNMSVGYLPETNMNQEYIDN